uniref:Integral membrane protein 2 n=1 Tax=Culicoides sonorensis TaxID=179676 RepID=A0A336MAC6_CULSO
MTIITKPSNVKKDDKAVPLVAPSVAPSILESGRNVVLVRSARSPAHKATSLILFLIALLVMCIGIIGGVMIYRQYAMERMQRMRFHGFCKIPFETDNMNDRAMLMANQDLMNDDDSESWLKMFQPFFDEISRAATEDVDDISNDDDIEKVNDNFLKEEFSIIDEDSESYSKINVPKLDTGRGATFLHDFKQNQTGIIDKEAKRCFFMPLDSETVLPPRDLRDLIRKLYTGYYNIDTVVLRKTMRVKVPEVTDKSLVSQRIVNECDGMKIYELEKIVSGVSKRSVDTKPAIYTQFAGKGFDTYHIANLDELDEYEAQSSTK